MPMMNYEAENTTRDGLRYTFVEETVKKSYYLHLSPTIGDNKKHIQPREDYM